MISLKNAMGLLCIGTSSIFAGNMGASDTFKGSLYFKLGSGGSYSKSACINNPNPVYWDASPEGYNENVGQSALYSAAIGYHLAKNISSDFEFIYRPSYHYNKYQTSTAVNTIFFNGNKTRYFDVQSNSIMWNAYLHGENYSHNFNYELAKGIFVQPFLGGGLGVGLNTVSNFHSILTTGSVRAIEATNLLTSFAWQLSAGLNFYNESNFNLGAGYRYYNGGKFSGNSYIINTTDTAPNWVGTVQANEFFIQLTYKIDK